MTAPKSGSTPSKGFSGMFALVALGSVVGIFAILNLIDFKRLD